MVFLNVLSPNCQELLLNGQGLQFSMGVPKASDSPLHSSQGHLPLITSLHIHVGISDDNIQMDSFLIRNELTFLRK